MVRVKLDLRNAYPAFQTHIRDRPIIGYRTWRVVWALTREGVVPLLASHATPFVWTGPIQRNSKKPIIYDGHARGKIDRNLMGFYTKRSAAEAVKHFAYEGSIGAIGQISMFGKVIEHKYGFRAQHVRVDHIILLIPRTLIQSKAGISIHHLPDSGTVIYQAIPDNLPLAVIEQHRYPQLGQYTPPKNKEVFDTSAVISHFFPSEIQNIMSRTYHCDVMVMAMEDKEQVRHYYEFMEDKGGPDE